MSINEKPTVEEIQRRSRRDRFRFDFADEIHDSIEPAEVREPERIVARIRKRSDGIGWEEIRVWRLSPLGVELVPAGGGGSFHKADPIDLELIVSGQRTTFEGLVVDVVETSEALTLLGVRLAKKVASSLQGSERRTAERWLCSDEFLPTCVAPTPARFDDFMYFQVRDVSADGLQLSCSLRNKFLIPGMRFTLTTVFPMAQVLQLDVEVVRVAITSLSGRDRLVVGTRFCTLSEQAKSILGQYILQFGNIDAVGDLRSAGLTPTSVALGVDFYNVKSEEDYREALRVRHIAHLADGNIDEGSVPEDMADINDARSRIIVGKYHGRVVATTRILFNTADEPMEHEAHVEWPQTLPRRDQIAESSRTAIDPAFRRNDVLAALFRFVYLNGAHGDRPFVVMSCLDHMVKFYERVGFAKTGLRHTEPLWKDDRMLNIMIANIHDLTVGRGVNPFYWNMIWRDAALYFSSQGTVKLSGMDKVRIMVYKSIAPVATVALWWMRLTRPKANKSKE